MEMLISKIYIIPIIIAMIFIVKLLENELRRSTVLSKKNRFDKVIKKLIPKEDSKIYKYYEAKCKHIRGLNVKKIYIFKIVFNSFVLIMYFLIMITNNSIYRQDLLNKYEYKLDSIYKVDVKSINVDKAMKEEMDIFNNFMKNNSKSALKILAKDKKALELEILKTIPTENSSLEVQRDIIANKVYYRVVDYVNLGVFNLQYIVGLLVFAELLPVLMLSLFNIYIKASVSYELAFLKRKIILHGSLGNDFNTIIKSLKKDSYYYKQALSKIYDQNIDNTIKNKDIYKTLINEADNIEEKLFYEKLEHGNNYDFNLAIVNLINEKKLDKKTRDREIKELINKITLIGIAGFFLFFAALLMYTIIPILNMYQVNV
jgi:hypothetical protein